MLKRIQGGRGRHDGPSHARQAGFSLLEAIIVVAITLILVAITSKAFLSVRNNYNVSATARQIASWAQVARGKATGRDTRYRVEVDATNRVYRIQSCTARSGDTCTTWTADAGTTDMPLPSGVTFSTSGISAAPAGHSLTSANTTMVFNSRGLLVDDSGDPLDSRCFFLQGSTNNPFAVCSNLPGRTATFRLSGTTWSAQ